MTGTTAVAAKGALQRARARLRRPPTQGRRARAEEAEAGLVATRFAAAYVDDDIEGLVALLTDDAWLRMPPATHLYVGRDAIREFLRVARNGRGARRSMLVPTGANRQPAFGWYVGEPGADRADPSGLIVLDIRSGGRVGSITRFHDPALVASFNLPPSVPQARPTIPT